MAVNYLALAASAVAAAFILYSATLVIYRVCFHPLAEFPGPKLAAVARKHFEAHDAFEGVGEERRTIEYWQNNNDVEYKDANAGFWKVFHDLSASGSPNHFPWLLTIINSLPDWMHQHMGLAATLIYQKKSKAQLEAIISNNDLKKREAPMIFREILNSDLPAKEKSVERLWHDSQAFNIAGSETSAWTLRNIAYYLLAQPEVWGRLKEELETVVKDGKVEETSTAELERLPYLTAVVKEGLRLSFGVAGRLYRISPDKPLLFKDGKKDWVIPAGTPIAMTNALLHLNPTIYPSPTTFDPSRWLNNPQLDRYLFSFGKGPRACVALNLAWAELYNTIAAIFGHHGDAGSDGAKMRLWQTTERDVLLERDYFVPFPWDGSQGVRVVVSS